MKIRCLANIGLTLPKNYLKPEFCYTPKIEFPLTIGQEYIVYAGSPEQRVIIKAYHEKQAKKRFRILSKFINP